MPGLGEEVASVEEGEHPLLEFDGQELHLNRREGRDVDPHVLHAQVQQTRRLVHHHDRETLSLLPLRSLRYDGKKKHCPYYIVEMFCKLRFFCC